jgi:hypothetical protein
MKLNSELAGIAGGMDVSDAEGPKAKKKENKVSKKDNKKVRKGRPTCKKDEDEEKKKKLNPKYKFINM